MSGGGGGGGDSRRQQAELEAKKAAARAALNMQFGVGDVGAMPEESSFMPNLLLFRGASARPLYGRGDAEAEDRYQQAVSEGKARYQQALQDWKNKNSAAEANKAAREQLYSTVRQNAFDAGKRRLDESQGDAKRNLKFELFAKGLGGGSVDVDQNALLDRTYNQGVIDLGAKADTVRNTLKSGDESTRLNLLQSIDAGMDQGSALSSAIAQMKNASDAAAAEATGATVGDIFGDAGLLYSDSVKRKRQQDARDYWATVMSQPRSASSGASGTVTSTR